MRRQKIKKECMYIGTLCMAVFFSCRVDTVQTLAQTDMQRYSEIFDTPEEIPSPEDVIQNENGKSYQLKESEILAVPVIGERKKMSGQTVYREVGRKDTIPETAVMTVKEEESKTEWEAELFLESVQYSNERWQDGFTFTATFHNYGAAHYIFGEIQIPHQEDRPDLSFCKEEFLKEIGIEPEECLIEGYNWAGEAYEDKEGILCRDVLISGKLKVWDCRAVYSGVIKLPDFDRYRMRVVYQPVSEADIRENMPNAKEEQETIQAVSEPEKEGEKSRLIRYLKRGIQVSIGVVSIAAALLALRILLKKAGEMKESE